MSKIVEKIKFDKIARAFIKCESVHKAIMGSPGSGKSTACCFALKRIAEQQIPNKKGVRKAKFLIVRRTNDTLINTTIQTVRFWFEDMFSMKGSIVGTQKPKGKYVYALADGTSVEILMVFKSLNTEKAVNDLKSLEVTSAWLNECNEIEFSFLKTIFQRTGRYPPKKTNVVGAVGPQMLYDFNPQTVDHWTTIHFDHQSHTDTDFFKQAPAILKRDSGKPRGEDHDDYYVNPEAPNLTNNKDDYYHGQLRMLLGIGDYTALHNQYMLEYMNTRDEDAIVFAKQFKQDVHVQVVNPPAPHIEVLAGFDTSGNHPCIILGQHFEGQFHIQEGFFAEGVGREDFTSSVIVALRDGIYKNSHIKAFCDPHDGRDAHLATSSTDWYTKHGIIARKAPTNNLMARIDAVRLCLQHKLPNGKPYLVISPKLEYLIKGLATHYLFKTVKGYGTLKPIVTPNVDKSKTRPYSDWVDALQYLCLELSNRFTHGFGSPHDLRVFKKARPKTML